MNAGDIYVKTDLGLQEVGTRKMDLSHRLRCALILVDGKHPFSVLQREARKLSAPEDFIEQLMALNLVARKEGIAIGAIATTGEPAAADDEFARFRVAKEFMSSTIVDALGIKSFFFTLKLEKMSTRADLKGMLGDYTKAMTKAMGSDVAQVMVGRVEAMLI
jgi:hypothetical protein